MCIRDSRETEQDNVGVESAHKSEEAVAVSYTHLDVYKRQAVLLLKSRGRTDDVFCEKEENGGMASSQSNRQLNT